VTDKLTIGIVALSSPSEQARFERGVSFLEELGAQVKLFGDAPFTYYGSTRYLFSADSASARVKALVTAIQDTSLHAILAVRGGYGTLEILEPLEKALSELLEAEKKSRNQLPLVGFSDTTFLLNYRPLSDFATPIHGPSLESAFCKGDASEGARRSAETLLGVLKDLTNGRSINHHYRDLTLHLFCGAGVAQGKIVGGNLSVLTNLLATPWQPDLNGKILFLEEVSEKPHKLHRMLLQLKSAGCLSQLAGVLLGDFSDCGHLKSTTNKIIGPTFEEVLRDIFKDYQYPVISGYPGGHEELNLPLPLTKDVILSPTKLEFL
jgi:muramoyltetrapeptide carboxypeptidase